MVQSRSLTPHALLLFGGTPAALFVAVVLLVSLSWPALRLVTSLGFWRSFPRGGVYALLALAAYFSTIAVCAVYLPGLTIWAGIPLAMATALAQWWLWRPGYGAARGLPPGSLAWGRVEQWTDRHFYEKLAAIHGPIFKVAHSLRPSICILGLQRGFSLLREFDDVALRAPKPAYARFLEHGFLRAMEPEKHRHYRRLVVGAVTPAVFAAHQEQIRADVRGVLARLAGATGGPDVRKALTSLAHEVLMRLLLGTDDEEEEVRTLWRRHRETLNRSTMRPIAFLDFPSELATRTALAEVKAAISARPPRPGRASAYDTLIANDPASAADKSIQPLLVYMTHAGSVDMGGLFFWLLKRLSEVNPAQPLSGADAAALVKETLRTAQSEYLHREALEDIRFEGFLIPKGWTVRICVWESHQDPAVFECPAAFRPERFTGDGAQRSRNEYAPFGNFRRSCVGEQYTIDMGRVFVEELTRLYRIESIAAGSVEYISWHWAPGRDFRFRLTARQPAA